MANYCTLEEIKSTLDIQLDKNNSLIMSMIESASDLIDHWCDRHFDSRSETRYFDGASTILFIDDLISITTLKIDEDGDSTYESTLAATDYVLYPLNTTPKTWIEISSNSDYGSFASGIKKGVEIAGSWGYGSTVPGRVNMATVIQVCRWFKRKDSGFATGVIGTPELGTSVTLYTKLDPDVSQLLQTLRRKG